MSPIILSVLAVAYLHGAEGQASCETAKGGSGTCISLYECDPLVALVYNMDRTPQDVDTLQKSQCGFAGTTPKVCCPVVCQTPDGQQGECISIYKCDHMINLLRPPVTNQNTEFVQNSKCKGAGDFGVCCGPPPKGNCETRVSAYLPDPQSKCCGVDSRVGNKIIGGTATTVDQYPWLAMIEYLRGASLRMMCGAALISGKYVLTAGHCVAGAILEYGTPTNVRLGEYDTGNEGPDCTPVEANGQDCTYGTTIIPIEQLIPHPDYNPISPAKKNDIALIRLTEMAPYTDFIRPICIPSVDLTLSPPDNFTLYVAGWGAVSNTQPKSKIKLHVKLPYVTPTACQSAYRSRKVTLWNKQTCAGGEEGKDSCKGDSGGPLMFENGRVFEAIGIVSFGPLPCGIENIPGVYTKVFEYKDWIKSTIRP